MELSATETAELKKKKLCSFIHYTIFKPQSAQYEAIYTLNSAIIK